MAYKRNFKKRNYKKRNYKPKQKSGWDTAMGVAKTALSVAKFVKSVINVEYKWSDLTVIPSLFDSNGITGNFHTIAQGVTANQREGDSLKMKSIFFKYSIQAAAGSSCLARVLVVKGINERTVAPTVAQLLSVGPGTANTVNSPRLVDPESVYQIIYDKTYSLNAVAGNAVIHGKMFRKLDHHVKYQQTTTNAESGGIYYFFIANAGGANSPTAYFVERTRYIDN